MHTCVVRRDMLPLHVIHGATTRCTRVHIHIERFMVEAALVNRLRVIVHGDGLQKHFEIYVDAMLLRM